MTQHSEQLPLFPLGSVLFPGMLLPMHIFEDRYRRLLTDRQGSDLIFGVVLTRQGREVADEPAIHDVGTAARLIGAGQYPDGRSDVVVQGDRRFTIVGQDWSAGYLTGTVSWIAEPPDDRVPTTETVALGDAVATAFEHFLSAFEEANGVQLPRTTLDDDPTARAYELCAALPIDPRERQALLESHTTRDRLRLLLMVLRRERDLLRTTGAGGATIVHPGLGFSPN